MGATVGQFKRMLSSLFKKQNRKPLERNVEEIEFELKEIQQRRRYLAEYVEELIKREDACQKYAQLDAEIMREVNQLAHRIKEIEEKKVSLKGRLIRNNAALHRLADYEREIPALIKDMLSAEKQRKNTESYILYLKEEQQDLEEERELLIGGYKFLKGVSIGSVLIISLLLLVSFILLQILREKIWVILSIVVVITMALFIGIVLIKEKLEKKLKDNRILQQKAMKYLNKCKIKYFNQTRYLEFQYNKLGVDSTSKLEVYYNRYLKNKQNEALYLKMNDKILEIEKQILSILRQNEIIIEDLGDSSYWLLKPNILQEVKNIKEDCKKAKEQYEALKLYEEQLKAEINGNRLDKNLKDA